MEIQRLYWQLGTYAAVAREVGRSASSVSKYVQMKDVPRNIRIAVENSSRQGEVIDMAEFCGVCNCKIGMFTGKVKFLDGSVCTKCYTNAGYSTWNTGEMASMGAISIARWKRLKDPNAVEPEETRIKCNTCGHLYCYTEDDIAMNKFYLNSAKTATNIGAFNAVAGNAVIGQANYASAERDLEKIKDFSRCPKCNSTDIRKLSKEEFESEKSAISNTSHSNISTADELKKFKELLDMGIITQEEFDAKKKQLLGL